MIVLLDSGPLGLVTNPTWSPQAIECNEWLEALIAGGTFALVPEIADYEVRRELIRAGKSRGIGRLDVLAASIGYLPLNTGVMRRAAEFWAEARRRGQPTAGAQALDGDVILAAQAAFLAESGDEVVVATDNTRHIGRFVPAKEWRDIP
jgi:hypothetical protein